MQAILQLKAKYFSSWLPAFLFVCFLLRFLFPGWFGSLLGVKFPSVGIWEPLMPGTGPMGKGPRGSPSAQSPPIPAQLVESRHAVGRSGPSPKQEYYWLVAAILGTPYPSSSSFLGPGVSLGFGCPHKYLLSKCYLVTTLEMIRFLLSGNV